MTIATSRGARQQRIVDLLHERVVRSQVELLELLAAEGIEVTNDIVSYLLKFWSYHVVSHGHCDSEPAPLNLE